MDPSDLIVSPDEDDYADYLNWLAHSDATLTFPLTVYLRYALQEVGVADAAAEGYKRWFLARLRLLEKKLESREYLCSDRYKGIPLILIFFLTILVLPKTIFCNPLQLHQPHQLLGGHISGKR